MQNLQTRQQTNLLAPQARLGNPHRGGSGRGGARKGNVIFTGGWYGGWGGWPYYGYGWGWPYYGYGGWGAYPWYSGGWGWPYRWW